MVKCVKITCTLKITDIFTESIKKQAQELSLEGTMQVLSPQTLKIIACGLKEKVDAFVDSLYKYELTYKNLVIEVEPFLKDKDYRGVFRLLS